MHANHPLILFKDKEDNSNPTNSYFSSQFPSLPLHAKCTKYKWRDRLVNSPFHSNFVKSNTIKTSKCHDHSHTPPTPHSLLPPFSLLSALPSHSRLKAETPLPIFFSSILNQASTLYTSKCYFPYHDHSYFKEF